MEKTSTDELRRMLDERGIEWSSPELSPCQTRLPYVKFEPWGEGTLKVTIFNLTPEQAIAATLGNEYHGYEQAAIEAWKSIKTWNQRHVETCRITASATDGLCTDRPRQYFELSCGHSFTLDGLEPPNCCPNCGKAVKR